MRTKHFILLLLMSGVITLGLTPLGAVGYAYKFIGCYVIYFFLSWRLFEKFTDDHLKTWLALTLPIILFYLPIHLLDFEETKIGLPSSLAGIIGILLGFILTKLKSYRWAVYAFAAILLVAFHFYIYPGWVKTVFYGQFNSATSKELPALTLKDKDGKIVDDDLFNNKVVILDFWNTSCGACFQKFPLLQELSDQYQNSNVAIYAVNVPLERDTIGQSFEVLQKRNFSFQNLDANDRGIVETMSIHYFPTTFIIVNGTIKFKGDLIDVNSQLDKLLNPKQL